MNPALSRSAKLLFWAALVVLVGMVVLVVVTPSAARSEPPAQAIQFPTLTLPGDTLDGSSAAPPLYCAYKQQDDRQPAFRLPAMSDVTCENGLAGEFPCNNVDLLSLLPLSELGGGEANDIWGWTDPQTGREYALLGRTNGTAFVDITVPNAPVYVGNLPTHTGENIWRGVKVYKDHAFIVADYNSEHGMQVFDLTQLRNVTSPPVTFAETDHYDGFGSAHNIVINEETGYAYATGVSSGRETCNGGLHMIDIRNPRSPRFAGCYGDDGYTHDAQCVVYDGPDAAHQGQEICFNSNKDTLTIVDVQNKGEPDLLSRTTYAGQRYTHQTWLTEDQQYLLMDDELDERDGGQNTGTYIWDVRDLDAPQMIGRYTSDSNAIDHNLYIRDGYAFEANFQSGLRILDVNDIASADLTEVGYFDFYPEGDAPQFNGAWGVYPFFESGSIIVSGKEQGLLVFRANLPGLPTITPTPTASPSPTSSPSSTSTATVTSTPTATEPMGTVVVSPIVTQTATPTGTPQAQGGLRLYLPLISR